MGLLRLATPAHMGHYMMSKIVTPAHYGETREDPKRSVAILKAWVLWRAGHHNWATKSEERQQEFAKVEEELVGHLAALPGVLNGNEDGDDRIRQFVPVLAARVEAVQV